MEKTKEVLLAERVAGDLNSFSFKNGLFVEAMARQHRTLQQSFTRLTAAWLLHLADLPDGRFDGRNEDSVALARKIKDILKDSPLPLV